MSVRTAIAATVGLLALSAAPNEAEACSCLPPAVDTSYWWSDATLHVRVLGKRTRSFDNYFIARVAHVYSGCDRAGDLVVLRSPVDSATCGLDLSIGDEYLINGYDIGEIRGFQSYSFGLCDYNVLWSSLTGDDLAFLEDRYWVCPDTGIASCADGSLPVSCLVDPCDIAPGCSDATAVCHANYCGGCNYEYWSDFDGLVCSGP